MTTMTKPRTGVASWKKLIGEAEQLRGQAGLSAHRRATILVQLARDDDFRIERNLPNDDALEDVLDSLVEDLCLTFVELRTMLQEFPAQDAWSSGKLSTLYSQTLERIAARKPEPTVPAITRRRATLKDFEKLAGEKQDVEARLRFVDQQHAQLAQEVERLRMENAELKGRILELERSVNRAGKAA